MNKFIEGKLLHLLSSKSFLRPSLSEESFNISCRFPLLFLSNNPLSYKICTVVLTSLPIRRSSKDCLLLCNRI